MADGKDLWHPKWKNHRANIIESPWDMLACLFLATGMYWTFSYASPAFGERFGRQWVRGLELRPLRSHQSPSRLKVMGRSRNLKGTANTLYSKWFLSTPPSLITESALQKTPGYYTQKLCEHYSQKQLQWRPAFFIHKWLKKKSRDGLAQRHTKQKIRLDFRDRGQGAKQLRKQNNWEERKETAEGIEEIPTTAREVWDAKGNRSASYRTSNKPQ
jgi:hypothetical protein